MHPAAGDDASPIGLEHDEELRFEAARAVLESVDAAHSPDPRLRFDLGRVYQQLGLQEQAIGVLEPALRQAPDAPGATSALEVLAYAYAKLDRPRDELATWHRYMPRLLDDRERIAPMMNMGEAEMRVGRLDDALATFRRTLELCESLPNSSAINSTYALSLWDLALALDRTGDPTTALETAAKARGWSWAEVVGFGPAQALRTVTGWDIIRDDRSVFFVPEWDREWYLALGDAASARHATDARQAAAFWAAAEGHWSTYVDRATRAGAHDPWIAVARVRLDRAHAAHLDAAARAAKLPLRGLRNE
jgi:tetratricopeptide (TPR) repeat protein